MSSAKAKIRVVLADDHPVVREGLKTLIDRHPQMEVVGEAADGRTACELVSQLQPDILVVDISMPQLTGTQTAEWIRREFPRVKVLALTVHEERSYLQQLLEAGAAGYVLKRSAAEELVRAILVIHSGGMHLDPAVAGHVAGTYFGRGRKSKPGPTTELSGREADVARLIALGFTNKEICTKLDVSVKTVETYKARVLGKLKLSSRADIVQYAIEQGWLNQEK